MNLRGNDRFLPLSQFFFSLGSGICDAVLWLSLKDILECNDGVNLAALQSTVERSESNNSARTRVLNKFYLIFLCKYLKNQLRVEKKF